MIPFTVRFSLFGVTIKLKHVVYPSHISRHLHILPPSVHTQHVLQTRRQLRTGLQRAGDVHKELERLHCDAEAQIQGGGRARGAHKVHLGREPRNVGPPLRLEMKRNARKDRADDQLQKLREREREEKGERHETVAEE